MIHTSVCRRPRALLPLGLLLAAALASATPAQQTGAADPARADRVRLGVEQLLHEHLDWIAGKRLGLITNPSGVDGELALTADRLAADERFELVRLFSPEHGIRGDVPAGESIAARVDERTGLPVVSLYGENRRPTAEQLAGLDWLLFDIQDVGSRTYTYVSTLGEAMIAAAEVDLPVLVLDRPNPLGGLRFEGPVRAQEFQSFIGWGPTPISHGMTVGELALFFNAELRIGCKLRVATMSGWRRSMIWGDTGLTWVQTSPHIPHDLHAHLYIATGMIGGTTENVNEGVGSTLPFETIAAEFIDADDFTAAVRAAALPGLRVRPIHYTPRYGKFEGRMVHGVQLLPSDVRALEPVHTAIALLCLLEQLYPKKVEFRDERALGVHWGNLDVVALVRAGKSPVEIEATWRPGLASFAAARARVLLY